MQKKEIVHRQITGWCLFCFPGTSADFFGAGQKGSYLAAVASHTCTGVLLSPVLFRLNPLQSSPSSGIFING
jgi:hypothetical protein